MKGRTALAFLVVAILAAPILAKEPVAPLPPDLRAVPADALGFVHIRVADIWKSEALKEIRDTVLKAGEKAIEGFDKRFLPHPSSIERLTVVLIPQDEKLDKAPLFFAILATNKDMEKDELLKSTLPNAVPKKAKFGSYYFDEKTRLGVSFISDRVIAFGPAPAIESYLAYNVRAATADGALTAALQMANSKKQFVAALNAAMIPAKVIDGAPPAVRPLLKAKLLTLAIDISGDVQIDAGLSYADDEQAKDAHDALRALAALGRAELKSVRKEMLAKVLGDGKVAPLSELPEATMALFALGAIERVDELLANPPIKRDGHSLQASFKLPSGANTMVAVSAVGVGLLLPAVQKVRSAAARVASQNNLKQISIAMLNYESAYGKFPPAAICDKNGKPLLSWRVAILPFIEQNNLYNQFKLDEPWDSEHNKKLASVVVKVYTHPEQPDQLSGICHYRLFYGKDAMFDLKNGRGLATITDGLSNTIAVVEAAEGVPWAKPDDFAYDPKKPLPKFATFSSGGFNAAFGDGSVRFLSHSLPEKTLRAYITANGGEIIDDEETTPKATPKLKPLPFDRKQLEKERFRR
jgi:prepilin-type processing-associated H-X9-DG protein